MPRIQIQMLKGRTAEQKRRLAKGVTEAASEALGISQERISLIMLEVEEDQLAHDGLLWCDREVKPPI